MSLSWDIVRRHADEKIEALRHALETAPTERVAVLQGEVRAWREVANLPAILGDDPAKRIEPDRAGYT